jgi:hypothetical protein
LTDSKTGKTRVLKYENESRFDSRLQLWNYMLDSPQSISAIRFDLEENFGDFSTSQLSEFVLYKKEE